VCVCVLPLNHLPRPKSIVSNLGVTRESLLTTPEGEGDRGDRAPDAAQAVPVARTSATVANVMILNGGFPEGCLGFLSAMSEHHAEWKTHKTSTSVIQNRHYRIRFLTYLR
jgi:hypothetical protein